MKTNDKLTEWICAQGIDTLDIGSILHELAEKKTSEINNLGLEQQTEMLRAHLGDDEAVKNFLRQTFCIEKDAPVAEEVSNLLGPEATIDVVVRIRMKLPVIENSDGKTATHRQYEKLVSQTVSEMEYDMGEGKSIDLGNCRVDIVETEIIDDGTDTALIDM